MRQLVLAALATYRLAYMVAKEDGPLFIFSKLRAYVDKQRAAEQHNTRVRLGLPDVGQVPVGLWGAVDEGIRCPYCLGFWFSLAFYLLSKRQSKLGDLVLDWLAVAGLQSFLQGVTDE